MYVKSRSLVLYMYFLFALQDYERGLNSMSLDDIERQASTMLNPTQTIYQPMTSWNHSSNLVLGET